MNRIILWFFKYSESWPVKNAYLTCRRELNGLIDICGENNESDKKVIRILAKCYNARHQINTILDKLK